MNIIATSIDWQIRAANHILIHMSMGNYRIRTNTFQISIIVIHMIERAMNEGYMTQAVLVVLFSIIAQSSSSTVPPY